MNKNIVILGGGSAGWLTALFLKKTYSNLNITVIEDPAQPPIIAGESGGVSLSLMLKYLKINISDWAKVVNAVPKLGSELVDWNGVGTQFTHGLIDNTYNSHYNTIYKSFLSTNREFLACAVAEGIQSTELFYNAALIKNNKLPILPWNNTDILEAIDTIMWHFDSRANAAYLKNKGISEGITLTEGRFVNAHRSNTGNIVSIKLLDQQVIAGDFFFDCSGFSRLLLHKELGVEITNLSQYFPARSVMAWWDDSPKLINHTVLTAMEYGWSWNINLHHRSGNGYLYDPDLISQDRALEEAEKRFKTKIDPVANLKFTPGLAREGWSHNVIAIGLSSGFLEPLEANGLAQVILQLELLERFWNPISLTIAEQQLYNDYLQSLMTEIMSFLLLHYKGHRRDTEFWKSHALDPDRTPDVLKHKLEAWRRGSLFDDGRNLQIYGLESYTTVLQGLDLINTEKLKERLLAKRPTIFKDFYRSYDELKKQIDHVVNNSLSLEKWNQLTYG